MNERPEREIIIAAANGNPVTADEAWKAIHGWDALAADLVAANERAKNAERERDAELDAHIATLRQCDDLAADRDRMREALEEIRSKPSDTVEGRNRIIDRALAVDAADKGSGKKITHGRHCTCSACAQEDWTNPTFICGMHGRACPHVYAPLGEPGTYEAAADKDNGETAESHIVGCTFTSDNGWTCADGCPLAALAVPAPTDTLPCGHPFSAVVSADEGTSYCAECAAAPTDTLAEALDDVVYQLDNEHLHDAERLLMIRAIAVSALASVRVGSGDQGREET